MSVDGASILMSIGVCMRRCIASHASAISPRTSSSEGTACGSANVVAMVPVGFAAAASISSRVNVMPPSISTRLTVKGTVRTWRFLRSTTKPSPRSCFGSGRSKACDAFAIVSGTKPFSISSLISSTSR